MRYTLLCRWFWRCSLLLTLWGLLGCAGEEELPTPTLYLQGDQQLFADVPATERTALVELIYVTDRQREDPKPGQVGYGTARSLSLAFGISRLEIGDNLSWSELVAESQREKRQHSLAPRLYANQELGRFVAKPIVLVEQQGRRVADPGLVTVDEQVSAQLQDLIGQRLATTPRKEALVRIHGFNYDFERATSVAAGLWHFVGRFGVPILYTWPSGSGGYFHERESSDFTVLHFKNFIKRLAATPGLERIQLVAHSRGTDIVFTAMRELKLEFGAQEAKRILKLDQVVMAAPDLDRSVVSQRVAGEYVAEICEQITIYYSPEDMVLGFAELLFADRRLGRESPEDLPQMLQDYVSQLPKVDFINAEVSGSLIHGYYYDNPQVMSDLILLLRDRLKPGEEGGRPLIKLDSNHWQIPADYPAGRIEQKTI